MKPEIMLRWRAWFKMPKRFLEIRMKRKREIGSPNRLLSKKKTKRKGSH